MKRNRYSHVGKTIGEKAAYRDFLNTYRALDKTVNDPIDSGQTDSSAFDEEEADPPKKISKKSKWLVFKDYINKNIVPSLIGTIIVAFLGWLGISFISLIVNDKAQDVQINDIKKDVVDIQNKTTKTEDKNTEFDKIFSIFKSEVGKDLELIKKKLNL